MIIDPVSQSLQRLPVTATEPARPPAQSALPAADPGTPTLSIRPAASSSIEPASLPETVGARIYEAIDAIGVGLKPKVASDGAKVDGRPGARHRVRLTIYERRAGRAERRA